MVQFRVRLWMNVWFESGGGIPLRKPQPLFRICSWRFANASQDAFAGARFFQMKLDSMVSLIHVF